jgi:hypothetical protein
MFHSPLARGLLAKFCAARQEDRLAAVCEPHNQSARANRVAASRRG